MAFCKQCGANVPEGIKFCTGCGNPMDSDAPQPVPSVVAAEAPVQQAPPVAYTTPPVIPPVTPPPPPPPYTPPPVAYNRGAVTTPDSAVMGTGAFIGFSFLFSIPVIGWIACIIMSFAGGNLNRRNFARSRLFFMIVGLVLSIVFYLMLSWIFVGIIEYLNEATNGAFTESGGFSEVFRSLS